MDNTRRLFLKNLGVSAAVLPFVSGLRSLAGDHVISGNKRLIIVFTPNGTLESKWFPTGNETDFALSPMLHPLAPYKDKMLILNGINNIVPGRGASAHAVAVASLLTGQEMVVADPTSGEGPAAGPSVDQVIADFLMGQPSTATRFPSLEFGDKVWEIDNPRTRLSYRVNGQSLACENNPKRMFLRVFGEAERSTNRKSVLDFVLSDFHKLQPRLSRNDAILLEQHADSVRQLEKTLSQVGFENCNTTGVSVSPQWDSWENRPETLRIQLELMVRALACNQTRVTTLMVTNGTGGGLYPWLGFYEQHHDLSHIDNEAGALDKLTAINNWFAQQVRYLLDLLQNTPESEGDGSMLDHSIVVWLSDFSSGRLHSQKNLPILLVSGGNYFRVGRYISLPNYSHSRFLLSLCQSFGLPFQSFGNSSYCIGGCIPELS